MSAWKLNIQFILYLSLIMLLMQSRSLIAADCPGKLTKSSPVEELIVCIEQIRSQLSKLVSESEEYGLHLEGKGVGVYGGSRGKSEAHNVGNHGMKGETWGDWGWASGVFGVSHRDHAIGVTGWNNAKGTGLYGFSRTGTAIIAKGDSGNLIEAWDTDPSDRRFSVANDGTVRADGAFNSGGADFAELMPGVDGLEPADVLVVDSQGRIRRSGDAFSEAVVGVMSRKPGFVGDEKGLASWSGERVPVAILGIVSVKVSGENGAIVPGNLLVSSNKPGHAMQAGSSPPVGTVIGKALEAFDGGQGTIKMLVLAQ